MPTLIRRTGSPFWFAAFDVPQPDGTRRRLKKSTKKKKKSEALAEALRIEEAELKKAEAEVRVDASKAFAIVSEAADAAARGELSEARARQFIARLSELSTGQRLNFYTVRGWVDVWIARKKSSVKSSSLKRYEASTRLFLDWLGERADARLEAISKHDVHGFRDAVRAGWEPPREANSEEEPERPKKPAKRSAKTANHYARDIAGLFRAAVREELLLVSPAASLEKLPENDSVERATFTLEEVSELVTTAGSPEWIDRVFAASKKRKTPAELRCRDWQGVILCGFYAGMRLGDICGMKWESVNLAEGVLRFQPRKTARSGKRLEVPMHPRLVVYFKEQRESGDPKTSVFPSLASTSISGNTGCSSQFIAIMEEGEIDRKLVREAKEGRRAVYARSFHSLRHSLASALANLDVSEEIRRQIVGHETEEVHRRYTHTETATLARAIGKLPSV